MNSETLLRLFTSWQIVAVCLFLMILLPVIFYVSSLKPVKKAKPASAKAKAGKPAAKKPKEEGKKEEAESVEEEEVPVRDGK